MKKISPGYLLPSAAYTIKDKQIRFYDSAVEHEPTVGDLVYLKVSHLGHHGELENKEGRIHTINSGTRLIGVLGNRYAPDFWEATIPQDFLPNQIDLAARSGVVGVVSNKKTTIKDPTKARVLGYVVDEDRKVLNTKDYCKIKPLQIEKKANRAKMILVVGTSMNAGKSKSAAAACWAIRTAGHDVRGSKITGTASLKDILSMEDSGASIISDFTHFGYPSTYLLSEDELLRIFNNLDLKYGNNPKNYWVVEIADGILQRETEILLKSQDVRSRIHKLVFAASGAMGAIAGTTLLRDQYDLVPDAISGVCSSSPLALLELGKYSSIPTFDSMSWNLEVLAGLLL